MSGRRAPTAGRVVHYGTTPQTAMIEGVNEDGTVDLCVYSTRPGYAFIARRVQHSDAPRALFWSWPVRPGRAALDQALSR